jgi:predicted dehydrogenase
MMALDNGFHVVIEKPITFTLDEAKQLKKKTEETGLILLPYTYIFWLPDGEAGKSYGERWRSSERSGKYMLNTRRDGSANFLKGKAMPRQPGEPIRKKAARAVAWEISEHTLQHLAEYITGAKISQICADLNIMVQGRHLDDDGNVLLRFDNGAAGVLMASQVAAGEENALKIRRIWRERAELNGLNTNQIL